MNTIFPFLLTTLRERQQLLVLGGLEESRAVEVDIHDAAPLLVPQHGGSTFAAVEYTHLPQRPRGTVDLLRQVRYRHVLHRLPAPGHQHHVDDAGRPGRAWYLPLATSTMPR